MDRRTPALRAFVVLLTACASLTSPISPAAAADNSVAAATLDDLVAETVAGNPELKLYQAELAAARGRKLAAGAWSNPELSAELGHKRIEDLGGNRLGDGPAWSVSIAQTFEFPGRLALRKAIADRQVAVAEIGLEQFRDALARRARRLGYEVIAARQRADAAEEVARRFEDLLAVLLQRDAAGVAPKLEARIIEANALTLGRRDAAAAIARHEAEIELNQLRGLPLATPIRLARQDLALNPTMSVDDLVASARAHNFTIRARIAELEQQGLRVQLSRNDRWPAVKIAPYVAHEKGADQELQVGLGVSVPLPVLDQNTGNIAAESAREAQAEVALAAALREVERDISATHMAYEAHLAQIAKWPPRVIQGFRDAARSSDEHYRLGALPIATYTELQKQYLDALDVLLDTQLDALEARQKLELLSGATLAAPGARE